MGPKAAIAITVVLVTIGFSVLLTRHPQADSKVVGMWQAEMDPETILDLRADGSFSSRTFEVNMRGHMNVRIHNQGSWRYAGETIYLKPTSVEATQDGQPFPEFLAMVGGKLGDEHPMKVRWIDHDKFGVDAAMGHFARRTPEQVEEALKRARR